jgi:ribosomal protein S18 acetylase RimI-like enzyme
LVHDRFDPPGALLADHVVAFVALVDGAPAACSMTVISGTCAGLYWIGTVPAERHRGLGRLVTVAAARAAFDRGARLVTLQATPAAESLYRRLGFVEVTRYRYYRSQPPAAPR